MQELVNNKKALSVPQKRRPSRWKCHALVGKAELLLTFHIFLALTASLGIWAWECQKCLTPVLPSAIMKMDSVHGEHMNHFLPFTSHFPTTQSGWISNYILLIILFVSPWSLSDYTVVFFWSQDQNCYSTRETSASRFYVAPKPRGCYPQLLWCCSTFWWLVHLLLPSGLRIAGVSMEPPAALSRVAAARSAPSVPHTCFTSLFPECFVQHLSP